MIVGPHFMPGACEGWVTGDRKLVCDLRERYIDDPKEAKPDANMRYRCIRTLGGHRRFRADEVYALLGRDAHDPA